jgi:S-adenosylhomocysteine hydrolase
MRGKIRIKTNYDICPLLIRLTKEFSPTQQIDMSKTLLVGMQHVLATTVDMLAAFKSMGLNDAVIGGKRYSTHYESIQKIEALGYTFIPESYQLGYGRFNDSIQKTTHRIWAQALAMCEKKHYELMIILDDGADLLRATPGIFFNGLQSTATIYKPTSIVGIEQTRGGTNHPLFDGLPFPIINVAGCFAKTQIEYPHVANIAAHKTSKAIKECRHKLPNNPTAAIIGYGTMGRAIARRFQEDGHSIIVYEKNPNQAHASSPNIVFYDNAAVAMANADVVIGCTGEDITENPANLSALLYSRTPKILVSTGSKDLEFNTLLRVIQKSTKAMGHIPDPLAPISHQNNMGSSLLILRGGFPINFDNTAHSVSAKNIWPTRACLMLAALTALRMRDENYTNFARAIKAYMLPPSAQMLIIKHYIRLNPSDPSTSNLKNLDNKQLLEYVISHSEGSMLDIHNDTLVKVG